MTRMIVVAAALLLAACGSSGDDEAGRTDAEPTPVQQTTVEVQYLISGSAARADVTTEMASGTEQQADLALPERSEGEHEATYGEQRRSGDRLRISAQSASGSGRIACEIRVDGETISEEEATSGSAVCEGET